MSPSGRKLRAPCGKQFHHAAQQPHQILARPDLNERWNEPGIQLERACRSPFDIRDPQHRRTFTVFRVRQQPHILARNLDRLLARASILVAKGGHFREVARAALFPGGYIQTPLAVVGNGQIYVQILGAWLEKFF